MAMGKNIAIGRPVTSEISPVNVGPKKYPAMPITPTRAMATAEATPFVAPAARINAGNIGPIPYPAHANPKLMMIKAMSG
jgi:hypothetical protein